MNKRGTASDVVFAVIFIFSAALGMFILNFVFDTMTNDMVNNTAINSSDAAVGVFEGIDTTLNRTDWIVFGVFLGSMLAILVTSWYIAGIPLFMAMYFIIISIGVLASIILSNVWGDFSGSSVFSNTVNNLPITNHIVNYLPFYIVVVGVAGFVIMFAKPSS